MAIYKDGYEYNDGVYQKDGKYYDYGQDGQYHEYTPDYKNADGYEYKDSAFYKDGEYYEKDGAFYKDGKYYWYDDGNYNEHEDYKNADGYEYRDGASGIPSFFTSGCLSMTCSTTSIIKCRPIGCCSHRKATERRNHKALMAVTACCPLSGRALISLQEK